MTRTVRIMPVLLALILLTAIAGGSGTILPDALSLPGITPAAGNSAAPPAPTSAGYARAEKFLPQNAIPSVYHAGCDPQWVPGTSLFWYTDSGKEGTRYMLVDTMAGTQAPAFDNTALAQALGAASGRAGNS